MRHLYRRGFPQHLMAGRRLLPSFFKVTGIIANRHRGSQRVHGLGQKWDKNGTKQEAAYEIPASALHAYRGEGTKNEDLAKVSGGRIGEPRTDVRQT